MITINELVQTNAQISEHDHVPWSASWNSCTLRRYGNHSTMHLTVYYLNGIVVGPLSRVKCDFSGRSHPRHWNRELWFLLWCTTSMDSTTTGRPCVCIQWRSRVSCPVSAAWHSCVATHWSKYHCYKQAPTRYDLRCLKATLNPNKQINKRFKARYKPNNQFHRNKKNDWCGAHLSFSVIINVFCDMAIKI